MTAFLWILGLVAFIWAVELINWAFGHRFNELGILPRHLTGLRGIPLSPFIHDGFDHVLANTLPIVFLGTLVGIRGKRFLLHVSLIVILLSGLAVWLAGRNGLHIGASGLVFGYFGYLVARGWYERSLVSIMLALIVLFFYGGLLFSLVQFSRFISWEGHLFGLLAGGIAARIVRK